MKHQIFICFIVIQAFVCTDMLPGVGPTIAGAIDEVASGYVRAATCVVDQAAPGAADTNPGTEEMPFVTVQHAADVVRPGDTVYVIASNAL